jgi:hypothetical protein
MGKFIVTIRKNIIKTFMEQINAAVVLARESSNLQLCDE